MPLVTAIICTMAEQKRLSSLLHAIDSLQSATSSPLQITVVVNGQRRSPEVMAALEKIPSIKIISLTVASLTASRLAGRQSVDTPYYCFLDDDDEYLPKAIDLRLEPMLKNDLIDFVISNGYRHTSEKDKICLHNLEQASSAPFHALYKENWLTSCGFLFRSDSIGVDYFEDLHAYVEWTWLAFKLCLHQKKGVVVDVPTFRIHDTPDSASKSSAYGDAIHTLYLRMLERQPPADIAKIIRQRMGANLHSKADASRRKGLLSEAWQLHLRSLLCPGGLRYLPFSRHLLMASPSVVSGPK